MVCSVLDVQYLPLNLYPWLSTLPRLSRVFLADYRPKDPGGAHQYPG